MDTVLSARNLTVGYSDKKGGLLEVQRALNLELRAGEVTSLMGQNGAGKSTLIRCLAGFTKPMEGEVLISGKPISKLSERDISKLVSVVLTENITQIGLSVYDLVSTGRYPYTGFFAKLSAEDHAKVEESLAVVGMNNFANKMLNELSDGERQKVMVAKALAQETPIVILDEPTAFLDLPSRIALYPRFGAGLALFGYRLAY